MLWFQRSPICCYVTFIVPVVGIMARELLGDGGSMPSALLLGAVVSRGHELVTNVASKATVTPSAEARSPNVLTLSLIYPATS